MINNGVVFGRFQPLHKGHIEHILTAKSKCNHLYVGITNPDPSMTKEDKTNIERSKAKNNPFTYYERYQMIEKLLISNNIANAQFTIIPFPLHDQHLIKYYCPLDSNFYISIYEKWGVRKKEILEGYKLNVEVMYNYPEANRMISGSKIRENLLTNTSWIEDVPKTTLEVINKIDLVERFKEL
ncbi:MAG: adenylyltransferase/cytidyltransferase family protein [Thiofilum sp.]|uniref:adenylyltransferase/cytidyltransferase family protein n=1 Tax=Thiofilum sp. TaxID=2212733 RepID=UPI002600E570|nr:adenylyltransferase/cytidyltransferase family protein [Thiofilum sp.]MBK8453993.1 adenylyltransferase/cytidyltransferase family protein [Thiofilum sp.]